MTVIVVAAAKGAPGVTTTTLALAARWPSHREPLVIEADPSGGDIVARLAPVADSSGGLVEAPSTVQLAALCRTSVTRQDLLGCLQRLPGRGEVRALVAPAGAFAAAAAIGSLVSAGLGSCLAGIGLDVLVDGGRIDLGAPTLELAAGADRVLLVARPTLESVLHTRDLAASLRSRGVTADLVVIGDRPYTATDASAAIGVGIAAALPDDPTGAAALAGNARSPKVLGRSRLVHAATELAASLAPNAPSSAASADPTHLPLERVR